MAAQLPPTPQPHHPPLGEGVARAVAGPQATAVCAMSQSRTAYVGGSLHHRECETMKEGVRTCGCGKTRDPAAGAGAASMELSACSKALKSF